MGGPGASVLLRKPLKQQQKDELIAWLFSNTTNVEEDEWGYTFWWKEDVFVGNVSPCLFYLSFGKTAEYMDDDEIVQFKRYIGDFFEQSINVSSGCNSDDDHRTLGRFILYLADKYDGLINMGGAITPPLRPIEPGIMQAWMKEPQDRVQEKKAFIMAQLRALEASLPPDKTMHDLFIDRHSDPDSFLKATDAEYLAKFGPEFPPEFSSSARGASLPEISAYVRAMPGKVYEFEYDTASMGRWVSHIVDRDFFRAWLEHPNFRMIK